MDFVGELHGFFHPAAPTPSFVLFFAFLDWRPDLELQGTLLCTEHALPCSIWGCPQPAVCLFICCAVTTMKARHLPAAKTAPVVANYDVINENDVIQGHMHTDGAAINAVPYPPLLPLQVYGLRSVRESSVIVTLEVDTWVRGLIFENYDCEQVPDPLSHLQHALDHASTVG